MTSPTPSSTASAGMAPASVPTSWLSSMMGLPSLTAPTASGFASTSLSASTASGSAAPMTSGSAMAAMEKKKEDEE